MNHRFDAVSRKRDFFSRNGISRNGISRNGISRNGISRSGISRNGISSNRTSSNGIAGSFSSSGIPGLAARRIVPLFAMAAACLMAPPAALASPGDGLSFPHALTPAFRWAEPVEMRLSGVPVVVRGFVVALTLEQAARIMARHEKKFQRVTTLPGSILLSGVHAGRHWVAQLEAAQGRVKGMVSALPLDIASAPARAAPGSITPWLTQNAQFVFGQSSAVAGRTVVQTIHVPDRPLDDFVGVLDRRLADAGWRRAGPHAWTAGAPAAGVSAAGVLPISVPATSVAAAGAPGKQSAGRRIDVFPVPASRGRRDAVLVTQSE